MFKDMSIGKKLLAGFITVALIAGIVGYVGIRGMNILSSNLESVANVHLPAIDALQIINEAQTAVDGAENALLSKNLTPALRKEAYDRFAAAEKRVKDARPSTTRCRGQRKRKSPGIGPHHCGTHGGRTICGIWR